MASRNFLLTLAFAALTAAGAQAADTTLSVKDEMKTVVDPASTTVFAVGGEVDPANGPDAAKVAPARWDEAGVAAARLEAVAGGLQQPGRAQDPGPWMTSARQMAATAAAAAKAARARDGAGLSQAANDLSDTCSSCHAKYRPKT
ncbi:MAG TPA: cytochrome c [Phenylobacterium sp.]|jgi:cytochrome c556|nr:cytochrome c [Phenylobacterium sp.]